MSDQPLPCRICEGTGTLDTHKDDFGCMMHMICPGCGGDGEHHQSPTETALRAMIAEQTAKIRELKDEAIRLHDDRRERDRLKEALVYADRTARVIETLPGPPDAKVLARNISQRARQAIGKEPTE